MVQRRGAHGARAVQSIAHCRHAEQLRPVRGHYDNEHHGPTLPGARPTRCSHRPPLSHPGPRAPQTHGMRPASVPPPDRRAVPRGA